MSNPALFGPVLLIGVLVLLLVGGLALAALDKHVDAGRKH